VSERLVVVSFHLPEPEGTAAGRVLLATVEGLLAEGHQVTVRSWRVTPPSADLPPWCTWTPPPAAARHPMARVRTLRRPRWDAASLDVEVTPGAIAVADEFLSFPAIASAGVRVVTLHYLTRVDAEALGQRLRPASWQDARAEAYATRHASIVLAYSPRVAQLAAAPGGRPIPMAIHAPETLVPLVDEPVAANVADWRWPPNRAALDHLLHDWPSVRAAVPGGRLLLAGAGLEEVGTIAGVEVLGPVERAADVLAQAAVLAFPCPPTSGPKTKVLEAMANGLAVVTTPSGVEGVWDGHVAAEVAPIERYAAALTAALRDPGRRAELRRAGRDVVDEHHAPRAAARARIAAIRATDSSKSR
jgi:glycosyltransferase involved in cell wall biosynthesis